MQINGIPDSITRTKYVALIEELGIDSRQLVSLKFGRDVIQAEVIATDANGNHMLDINGDSMGTHAIVIQVLGCKPDRTPAHQCELPDGPWIVGGLWCCTEGHLWQIRDTPDTNNGHVYVVRGLEWVPASWRTRRKYGPGMKRATRDMAPQSARKWKPKPPRASASAAPPPNPPAAELLQPAHTTCVETTSMWDLANGIRTWLHGPGCPQETRTPAEWEKECAIQIIDPIGWRKDGQSWATPITRAEFRDRAEVSTVGASGTLHEPMLSYESHHARKPPTDCAGDPE
jgi:hypothetical protein